MSVPAKESRHSLGSSLKTGEPGFEPGDQSRQAPLQGYVYFVQEGRTDSPVKIGYSTYPDGRMEILQRGNPNELFLIAAIPGGIALEQRLHRRFAEGRIRGEWFRHDTPGLSEFITAAAHVEFFPSDKSSRLYKLVASA